MNCAEAREGLSAALDGALAAEEARQVEAHAASCSACRAWRAEMADVRGLLRGLDDADEPPGRTAAVGRGVLAIIEGRAPAPGSEDRQRVRRGEVARWLVGVALVTPVVLFGVLLLLAGIVKATLRTPPAASSAAPSSPRPGSSSSSARPEPVVHGHLDMRAGDEATRDALRALFAKWPGTVSATQPDAGDLFALTVDFEGPSRFAGDFEKELSAFQRAHAAALRRWSLSSEVR